MRKLLLFVLFITISCNKDEGINDINIVNTSWTGFNTETIENDGIYKETTTIFFNPDKTNAEFTITLSWKSDDANEYKDLETNHYKFTYNYEYPNTYFFCDCDYGEQYGQLHGKFEGDKFTIAKHDCLWETPASITCSKK